jgi:hypothetical protein
LSIFKIFEKKQKKKTEEGQQERVFIDELNSWLADRISDELHGVYAQGDEIRRHVQSDILSIKQIIEDIEEIGSKKGPLISAIDRAADVASMEVHNFEGIVDLRENLTQEMTHLGEAWNTYKRSNNAQQKGMRSATARVYGSWKLIDGQVARLNTLINTHSPRVTALKLCQEQAELLTTRVKDLRETAEKLNALGNNLQPLESTRASIEIQIERIKSTGEYEASLKLREELSMLENRRMKITSRVSNDFSSLRRPIDKYGHVAELSKEKRRLLDSYIGETPRALSATNNEETAIQEILRDLRKYILEGRIEIKNPQKTASNIEEMLTELPKLRGEYRALTGQIEKFQSRANSLSTVEEDFKGLEVKLREAREAIERVKLESKEIGEERQPRLDSEINALVDAVERSVYENFGIPLLLSREGSSLGQSRSSNANPGSMVLASAASSSSTTNNAQPKPKNVPPSHQSSTTTPPQKERTTTEPIAALKEKLARGKIDEDQFEKLAKQRYDYLRNKPFSELSDSELEERINGFEGLDIYPKY